MVARRAVRTAAELIAPETAKELRAARRKLGLGSLTISERKAKTDVRLCDDAFGDEGRGAWVVLAGISNGGDGIPVFSISGRCMTQGSWEFP